MCSCSICVSPESTLSTLAISSGRVGGMVDGYLMGRPASYKAQHSAHITLAQASTDSTAYLAMQTCLPVTKQDTYSVMLIL